MSVLDVHSKKRDIGKLYMTHAWNLTWRCSQMVTSQKLEKRFGLLAFCNLINLNELTGRVFHSPGGRNSASIYVGQSIAMLTFKFLTYGVDLLNFILQAYSSLYQDPLSALDAHVGKAVFQNVLLNSVSGKTRILVTHALHFLPQVDYIYTIVDGHIAERGTYTELMESNGEFAKFVTQFGSHEEGHEEEKAIGDTKLDEDKKEESKKKISAGQALIQAEERNTGAIAWSVYKVYGSAGRGQIIIPLLLLSLALVQGATVMSSYW
jgi:hypothetical protein